MCPHHDLVRPHHDLVRPRTDLVRARTGLVRGHTGLECARSKARFIVLWSWKRLKEAHIAGGAADGLFVVMRGAAQGLVADERDGAAFEVVHAGWGGLQLPIPVDIDETA